NADDHVGAKLGDDPAGTKDRARKIEQRLQPRSPINILQHSDLNQAQLKAGIRNQPSLKPPACSDENDFVALASEFVRDRQRWNHMTASSTASQNYAHVS